MSPPGIRFAEPPPGDLYFSALEQGETQLWAIRLDPCRSQVEGLASHLSGDELERASRYYFGRDRRRYRVRWGFLRGLLGHHLDCPANAVRFTLGREGKPYLAGHPDLHFNLSHSGELALIGLSRVAPLGVDIEDSRRIEDADAIARRFFAPGEVSAWLQSPESLRRVVFFNCWTRKEAFLKASGLGITSPLDRFEVSVLPDEPARVVTVDGEAARARGWSLTHLEPAPGYIGALAMRPAPNRVNAWIVDLGRTAPPDF